MEVIYDGFVIFVSPVKTGVQRISNSLKELDSGFRRNDRKLEVCEQENAGISCSFIPFFYVQYSKEIEVLGIEELRNHDAMRYALCAMRFI
jgi:hypothetical protein